MNYISFSDYAKSKYGDKVYKLSIEGGKTCPNRDGTVGYGGCIYCSTKGSGNFAEGGESVTAQLERAKSRVASKCKSGKYIAYFQSFTVTYLPLKEFESKVFEALSLDYIVGISLATRPDCLPDSVIEIIERANKIKPVTVELGLQTMHKDSATYIRRGYKLHVFEEAVEKLKKIGVHTVAHLIVGLPGESTDMIKQSALYAAQHCDGIKLQMLHVLRDTDLEKDYKEGKFTLFTLEEYTQIICDILSELPEKTVIHRLTGDGDKKELIAPMWTANKKLVINTLLKAIKNTIHK
ncbi:MAG: TIGR01212 family radical SAM protein [Clostridia bacterium]|nr:TIGR01212 family radical SAM protein [Clostridia bacterium]